MAKNKNLTVCPNCGSRNIQFEGHGSKGKKTYCCSECDEVFEIYAGDNDKRKRKESNKYLDELR